MVKMISKEIRDVIVSFINASVVLFGIFYFLFGGF